MLKLQVLAQPEIAQGNLKLHRSIFPLTDSLVRVLPEYLALLEIRGNASGDSGCQYLSDDVDFDPSNSLCAFLVKYLERQTQLLTWVIGCLAKGDRGRGFSLAV